MSMLDKLKDYRGICRSDHPQINLQHQKIYVKHASDGTLPLRCHCLARPEARGVQSRMEQRKRPRRESHPSSWRLDRCSFSHVAETDFAKAIESWCSRVLAHECTTLSKRRGSRTAVRRQAVRVLKLFNGCQTVVKGKPFPRDYEYW